MSRLRMKIAIGAVLGISAAAGIWLSVGYAQNAKTPAAEALLPASTVLYAGWDGNAVHQRSWEATAAYQALHKTGLVAAVQKFFDNLSQTPIAAAGGVGQDALKQGIDLISQKGCSLSVSLIEGPMPFPQITIVLHEAAELQAGVTQLVQNIGPLTGMPLDVQEREVSSRKVSSIIVPTGPNGPPVEVGWWAEGSHLVVTAGINAIPSAIAIAAGEAPNLTTNKVFATHKNKRADFEVVSTAWLDFGALRSRFGEIALPPTGPDAPPATVNQVLQALGLDTLGALSSQSGYKGAAMWSETVLEAPGERRGLLALANQPPITLKDLPPLPFGMDNFYASSVDLAKVYDELSATATRVAALGPPDIAAQVEGFLASIPAILGFDLKDGLLDPLGHVSCLYGDTRQGFLGMGTGFVIQVDDAAKVRATIDTILQMAVEQSHGDFAVRRAKKQGREIIMFEFGGKFPIGALAVDDRWLAIGLIPQTVEAFLLRLDGQLTVWKPTESYVDGFKAVPQKFTSVMSSDPRKSYRTLLGIAPIIAAAAQTGLKQAGLIAPDAAPPVTIADVPPAELVARPLFPNVSVTTVDDEGIHWTSRTSLPTLPFLGGGGGASSIGSSAVLIALLLPAVQQAREAARRSQSKNNLKQIALALHNYHDTHGGFPEGTHPNEKLKPDKQLSWLVKILPFLEQAPLYQQIDFEKAWDDEANQKWMKTSLEIFLNPSAPKPENEFGVTQYVGIAGLGEDGPKLPVNNAKAGAFGYNRVTNIRDITDGTSNTMGVAEAVEKIGPWGAGGPATIRPLTKEPYINGPDGFGRPTRDGVHIMMMDGSVRFVSKDIDPKVFEALSTIAGGEVIQGF